MWMKVKRLHDNAKIPTRAHDTDAGLDVYCVENEVIREHGDKLIKTGISIAIPDGWVAVVKEKSGIATKNKVTVGACVIDSGYRGELMIHLFNNGDIPATFVMGNKIAQLVVVPCWTGQPEEVEDLDNTPRGDGGFGSTDLDIRGVKPGELIGGILIKKSRQMGNTENMMKSIGSLRRKTDTPEAKKFWNMVNRIAKRGRDKGLTGEELDEPKHFTISEGKEKRVKNLMGGQDIPPRPRKPETRDD